MNNQLGAAEAVVLLHPNRQNGGEALRFFLIELAARGVLSVRREGWRKKTYVAFAKDIEDLLPAGEFGLDAWRGIGGPDFAGTEVPVKAIIERAIESFAPGFGKFRTELILPTLEAAGLVSFVQKKVLGVFPSTRVVRTARGEETARHIELMLAEFKGLRGRYDGDPAAVDGLVRTLGPVILLAPDLRRHHKELDGALKSRTPITAGAPAYFAFGSGDAGGSGFDFGSFGGIGGAFGGFDGGGGDGGGGDGGGGGGGD